jgi:hypothetical protein
VNLEAGDRLRVAAVEAFRESKNRGQDADDVPALAPERAVVLVPAARRRLPVIAGDEADNLDLLRLEAAKIPILDQIVGMLMVPFVTDVYADIV